MRLPADLNSSFWYYHEWGISAAARVLAVAAVTVEHEDWIGIALILDGAASALAGKLLSHGHSSEPTALKVLFEVLWWQAPPRSIALFQVPVVYFVHCGLGLPLSTKALRRNSRLPHMVLQPAMNGVMLRRPR